MTCNEAEKNQVFQKYIERKLEPDQEQAFEQHYTNCTHCCATLKEHFSPRDISEEP